VFALDNILDHSQADTEESIDLLDPKPFEILWNQTSKLILWF